MLLLLLFMSTSLDSVSALRPPTDLLYIFQVTYEYGDTVEWNWQEITADQKQRWRRYPRLQRDVSVNSGQTWWQWVCNEPEDNSSNEEYSDSAESVVENDEECDHISNKSFSYVALIYFL
jgi:hypothetical protein